MRVWLHCGQWVETPTPNLPHLEEESIQERDKSFRLLTTEGTTMRSRAPKVAPGTFTRRRCQEKTDRGNVFSTAPEAIAVAQSVRERRVAVYRCRTCDLWHLGKESIHLRVVVHDYWSTRDVGVHPFLNSPVIGELTPFGVCCKVTPDTLEVESEE